MREGLPRPRVGVNEKQWRGGGVNERQGRGGAVNERGAPMPHAYQKASAAQMGSPTR